MIPQLACANLTLALTKIPIFAILFIAISTIIVVLWQRQPRPTQKPQESQSTSQASQKQAEEKYTISPADGTVVNTPSVKFTGKSEPATLVVIYSNDASAVAKTKSDGTFELQLEAEPGLNLLKAVFVSQQQELAHEKNFSLYMSAKDVGKSVAAGSVKSIFDNLITITTNSRDVNIRTGKSTNFDVPTEEDVEEATEEVDNIRIGDYVIATGDASDQDSIIAKNLLVLRVNKPILSKEIIVGKIASSVRQNIFSAKNNKDGKIVEFTLDKNSQILLDGQDAKLDAIAKDKSAIILYTKDKDTNLIDLLYLLP